MCLSTENVNLCYWHNMKTKKTMILRGLYSLHGEIWKSSSAKHGTTLTVGIYSQKLNRWNECITCKVPWFGKQKKKMIFSWMTIQRHFSKQTQVRFFYNCMFFHVLHNHLIHHDTDFSFFFFVKRTVVRCVQKALKRNWKQLFKPPSGKNRSFWFWRLCSYHAANTDSHSIPEVKQRWALSLFIQGMLREHRLL